MPMTTCRECQAEISDKAITCPKCGAPALQSFARVGGTYETARAPEPAPAWVGIAWKSAVLVAGTAALYVLITRARLGQGEGVGLAVLIGGALFFGAVGYVVGNGKRQGTAGALLGALLGPIGVLAAFFIPHRKKCPHCFHGVDPRARICPHCRTPLVRGRA